MSVKCKYLLVHCLIFEKPVEWKPLHNFLQQQVEIKVHESTRTTQLSSCNENSFLLYSEKPEMTMNFSHASHGYIFFVVFCCSNSKIDRHIGCFPPVWMTGLFFLHFSVTLEYFTFYSSNLLLDLCGIIMSPVDPRAH